MIWIIRMGAADDHLLPIMQSADGKASCWQDCPCQFYFANDLDWTDCSKKGQPGATITFVNFPDHPDVKASFWQDCLGQPCFANVTSNWKGGPVANSLLWDNNIFLSIFFIIQIRKLLALSLSDSGVEQCIWRSTNFVIKGLDGSRGAMYWGVSGDFGCRYPFEHIDAVVHKREDM